MLLFDVYVYGVEFILFMGKFVFIVILVVEIVLKFGVVMILYFVCCQVNGLDFDIYIENFIQFSDLVIMMIEVMQCFEWYVWVVLE